MTKITDSCICSAKIGIKKSLSLSEALKLLYLCPENLSMKLQFSYKSIEIINWNDQANANFIFRTILQNAET
jgi:hypothetical protein